MLGALAIELFLLHPDRFSEAGSCVGHPTQSQLDPQKQLNVPAVMGRNKLDVRLLLGRAGTAALSEGNEMGKEEFSA